MILIPYGWGEVSAQDRLVLLPIPLAAVGLIPGKAAVASGYHPLLRHCLEEILFQAMPENSLFS